MRTAREMIDNVNVDMGVNVDDRDPGSPVSRRALLRYLNEGQRELVLRITKIKEDYLLTSHSYTPDPETGAWPDGQFFPLPTGVVVQKVRQVWSVDESGTRCRLRPISLSELAGLEGWPGTSTFPTGWRIIDKGEEGARTAGIEVTPPRSLGSIRRIVAYYIRGVPDMAESDHPHFPESDVYLESYAKWRVALVDPSRTTELYEAPYENHLRNLLETFTDRTPQDGGTMLELSEDDRAIGEEPVDFI